MYIPISPHVMKNVMPRNAPAAEEGILILTLDCGSICMWKAPRTPRLAHIFNKQGERIADVDQKARIWHSREDISCELEQNWAGDMRINPEPTRPTKKSII
jgi:hypothetical protein